jgi:iron only hydrogenase large subunit-like protein
VGKKETSFFSIRAIIQKMRKSLLSFTKCQSHCYHSQNAKVIAIIQKMPKSLLSFTKFQSHCHSFTKCQSHCYHSKNAKVIAIRSQNAKVIAIIQKMRKSLPFVPGWICYAEKTHGSWVLPYISRVKSAQQVTMTNFSFSFITC